MNPELTNDLLYQTFERHLYQHSEFDVSVDEFIKDVVNDYLGILATQGITVPLRLRTFLEQDLEEEVREMTQKKTYGHMSISEFRFKNAFVIEQFNRKMA